jgi:hypothetical protein
MAKSGEVVTVTHGSGKRETGTIHHGRSGTGTSVVIGNREVSYPSGKGNSIKVTHDGGASVKR